MRHLLLFCFAIFGFFLSLSFQMSQSSERPSVVQTVADCQGCITLTPGLDDLPAFLSGQYCAVMPTEYDYKALEQAPNERKLWHPKLEYIHATKYSHFLNRKIA